MIAMPGLAGMFHPAGVFGQDAKSGLKIEDKATARDNDDEDAPRSADTVPVKEARNASKDCPAFAIGIEAGVNLASMNYFPFSNDFMLGGRGGIIAEIRLSDKAYIQPGIFYAMNGAMGKESYLSTASNEIVYVNTIEVPVLLLFKLGQRRQFLLGAGGYVGDNISGHLQDDLKIGSSYEDDLKPIDYGLKVCLGHQSHSGFFFKAAFQKGLANLNPNADYTHVTTTCITLDFGFVFGENRKHRHIRSTKTEDAWQVH